jgi:YHS domain-containing protein
MAVAIDPVCLMEVDTENPPGGQSEHQGTHYYFCGRGCKVAFDRDPEHVLSGEGVVPMEHGSHGHGEPRPSGGGGIMGFLRGLFGGKTLSD